MVSVLGYGIVDEMGTLSKYRVKEDIG